MHVFSFSPAVAIMVLLLLHVFSFSPAVTIMVLLLLLIFAIMRRIIPFLLYSHFGGWLRNSFQAKVVVIVVLVKRKLTVTRMRKQVMRKVMRKLTTRAPLRMMGEKNETKTSLPRVSGILAPCFLLISQLCIKLVSWLMSLDHHRYYQNCQNPKHSSTHVCEIYEWMIILWKICLQKWYFMKIFITSE